MNRIISINKDLLFLCLHYSGIDNELPYTLFSQLPIHSTAVESEDGIDEFWDELAQFSMDGFFDSLSYIVSDVIYKNGVDEEGECSILILTDPCIYKAEKLLMHMKVAQDSVLADIQSMYNEAYSILSNSFFADNIDIFTDTTKSGITNRVIIYFNNYTAFPDPDDVISVLAGLVKFFSKLKNIVDKYSNRISLQGR